MEIRHTRAEDLPRLLEIYQTARDFMASHGNPTQWGPTHWPPEALLREDIRRGKSYVCTQDNRIVGTFFFDVGEEIEPGYRRIEEGGWLAGGPYGVVHRLAGDGSVRGVGQFCLDWCWRQCGHLRIDTHGDNAVMQRLLAKLGFVHCGTIYVAEDPYPRLAYEKI